MNEGFRVDEVLINFLEGTFHQDIESPESAVEELKKHESREWIENVIQCGEKFLNSNVPEQEKNRVIESHTEIYFPAIGFTPVKWLRTVIDQLKEGLDGKNSL